MLLDIDLWTILINFGNQVGMENQLKFDPKRRRKNDAKKKGTKMANKTAKSIFDSQEEPYTFCPPPRGDRTNFRDLDPVWYSPN